MNRYSLVFALLIASSFAVHPTRIGEGPPSESGAPAMRTGRASNKAKTLPAAGPTQPLFDEPIRFLNPFLQKALPASKGRQGLQILFATVPHPVETNLGSAFDHNVEALQDGLQEAGYLFDSSWIPWSTHSPREDFEDDEKEKDAKVQEDDSPGILLFRKNEPGNTKESYSNGIIVFLLSEKPTQGIAASQVKTAWQLLQQRPLRDLIAKKRLHSSGPIRILGPTFSGSFPSLNGVVRFLQSKYPSAQIIIRSGGVTGGEAALTAMREIAAELPRTWIDFGSAHHDYSDWDQLAESTLGRMGIESEQIAFLSEDESSFGWYTHDLLDRSSHRGWRVSFPRDISSLRAGYAQQGIFDFTSPAQPWKRFLNLKSDAENEGDSVRSFGGEATVGTQEAILFGISEFLKSQGIRAVVISATNEEDRLFLTQFLHTNNSGVRIVVIGNTRIFMRGSTAQFRGDLMVDDFPMLPRLHYWTGSRDDHTARVFADDVAQGTFLAAVDLFEKPQETGNRYKWYPEYSEPDWGGRTNSSQWPPLYVVALGSNSTWPVAEGHGSQLLQDDSDSFLLEMPFTPFAWNQPEQSDREAAPSSPTIHVGRYWKILALLIVLLVFVYCVAIWYANPISRDLFASFQPSETLGFWLLKVTIPAAVFGSAFWVLAWAVAIPANASNEVIHWWWAAQWAIEAMPFAIILSAVLKSILCPNVGETHRGKILSNHEFLLRSSRRGVMIWRIGTVPSSSRVLAPNPTRVKVRLIGWFTIAFFAVLVALTCIACHRLHSISPVPNEGVGSILNTYREMHWESGLSLLPTLLLFLAAILVWSSQAGNGAAVLRAAPPVPTFADNLRISQDRSNLIRRTGRPLPSPLVALWLWITWGIPVALLAYAHFRYEPFRQITTLESREITFIVRGFAALLAAMTLFDALHFVLLWDRLRGLLAALAREPFKRSFVAIRNFDWRSLWSFSGVSFQSRRAINAELIDCLLQLSETHGLIALSGWATALKELRRRYNTINLDKVPSEQYADDSVLFFGALSFAGNWLAKWISDPNNAEPPDTIPPPFEAIQRAIETKSEGGAFANDEEELARLPERQQLVERFLCLMYIGFIQSLVARLHTLLISVAFTFSLLAIGVTIYPFVPLAPLMITGGILLLVIAWAFFKVFSQMDTDPILSRIVNGDDRKIQGSFYARFAEAMALPLLTAGSTLLPGGAGRLLDLVQAIFSRGQ
jgi:hypothetical protein